MAKTKQLTTKQAIKKANAIEAWQKTNGHVTNLCKIVGITRKTFYSWMKKDPEFALGIVDAEAELNDEVRDALISKIADGDMTAIIFYLRRRHPDFQDRSFIQQNNQFNLDVKPILGGITLNYEELLPEERKEFDLDPQTGLSKKPPTNDTVVDAEVELLPEQPKEPGQPKQESKPFDGTVEKQF